MDKTVKIELIEVSASKDEMPKGVRKRSKVGRRGPRLQENGKEVKEEPRVPTLGLLDATLSGNVARKNKGQSIEMGMFSACAQGKV